LYFLYGLSIIYDSLHPADLPVLEPDFYAMRVVRGVRQYVFNDPPGTLTCTLVLLKHDFDLESGMDVFSELAVQA